MGLRRSREIREFERTPEPRGPVVRSEAETVAGIRITSPDRVLFEEMGVTKLALARRLHGLHSDPWKALRRTSQNLTAGMKRRLGIENP